MSQTKEIFGSQHWIHPRSLEIGRGAIFPSGSSRIPPRERLRRRITIFTAEHKMIIVKERIVSSYIPESYIQISLSSPEVRLLTIGNKLPQIRPLANFSNSTFPVSQEVVLLRSYIHWEQIISPISSSQHEPKLQRTAWPSVDQRYINCPFFLCSRHTNSFRHRRTARTIQPNICIL